MQASSWLIPVAGVCALLAFGQAQAQTAPPSAEVSRNPPQKRVQALRTITLPTVFRQFAVDSATQNQLQRAGVQSLSQLRTRLRSTSQPLTGISSAELEKLRVASVVTLVSDNDALNAGLARRRISSVAQLAGLSARQFVEAADGKIALQEAEIYRARAKALQNAVSVNGWRVRNALSNPSALSEPVEIAPDVRVKILAATQGLEPACTFECNEDNNIFSPAVYVLYLLDFVAKSFDQRLDSLDEIDQRFLQPFGAVTLSQDVGSEESYVRLSNVILENMVAAADPGDNLNNDLYKTVTSGQRLAERQKIYNLFTANRYRHEPGFSADVVGDLFESYVREAGTTRAEVRFALSGSSNMKARFAELHQVTVDELAKLGGPENLQATTLQHIEDAKTVLAAHLRRREEKAHKEQLVTETADLTQREFQGTYRARRATALGNTQRLLLTILEQDPSAYPAEFDRALFAPLHAGPGTTDESRDAYDRALLAARDAASECLYTAAMCPATSPWRNRPINFILELFRAYPQHIPAEYRPSGTTNVPAQSFDNLKRIRAIEHCRTLENGGGVASRIALLLKEEGKWKPAYDTSPPTCTSLSAESNLPNRSLQFAAERVNEADGLEQEVQLRNIALARLNQDLANAANAQAFQEQVDRLARASYETALSRAEQAHLERIRANLLAIVLWKLRDYYRATPTAEQRFAIEEGSVGGNTVLLVRENLQRLGDHLALDLSVEQTQRTTPLSLAISRIHSFVQAARLGVMSGAALRDFDESTWRWLGSFGTWHAHMMVSAYPSNFLIPAVRQNQTEQFERLLSAVDLDASAADDHYAAFAREVTGFKYLDYLASFATPDGIFVLAKIPAVGFTGALYYSVLADDKPWSGWHVLAHDKSSIGGVIDEKHTAYDEPVFLYRDGFLHVLRIVGDRLPARTGDNAPYCNDLPTTPRTLKLLHVSYEVEGSRIKTGLEAAEEGTDGKIPWEELETEISIPAATFIGGAQLAVDSMGAYVVPRYLRSRDTCNAWRNPGRFFFARLEFDAGAVSGKSEIRDFADATLTMNVVDVQTRGGLAPLFVVGGFPNGMRAWSRHITSANTALGDLLTNMTGMLPDYQAPGTLLGGLQIVALPSNAGRDPQLVRDLVGDQAANGSANVTHYRDSSNHSFIDVEYFVANAPARRKTIRLDDTSLFRVELDYSRNRIIGFSVGNDGRVDSNGSYWYGSLFAHDLHDRTKTTLNLWRDAYSSYSADDLARLYLDELGLHAPYAVSLKSTEEQRYEEAMQWLSRIYDPVRTTEPERRVFAGFADSALGAASVSSVGQWLTQPFDPFALADLNRHSYLLRVKLTHVENVLDWADRLFTVDTSESVNRARGLYELAAGILALGNWPQSDCDLQRFSLRMATRAADGMSDSSANLGEWLGSASPNTIRRFSEAMARPACAPLKNAAFQAIAQANRSAATLAPLMQQRASADSHLLEDLALGDADMLAVLTSSLGSVELAEQIPGAMEFCLPMNPLLPYYRWRIESNLEKIRTNRNFAGVQRNLQPYATPVDPARLVKQAATGGIDYEEFIPSGPPPVYRYTFLRERAKYLVSLAQQFENSMVAALEKEQQASYDLFKARQDLRLERANVTLQSLRVTEARDSIKLADLQADRAQFQQDHFQELIDRGNLHSEDLSLTFMYVAATLQFAAGATYAGMAIAAAATGLGAGVAVELGAQAASTAAGGFSTLAASFATTASYERRRQEWEFQRDLAGYDLDFADVGITLAEDRADIVTQEKSIAELRKQNAEDTIELLGNRTLNAELYRWMNTNLRRLYREQLNMAIATAKAAQLALEFERQRSLDFIGFDYWDEDRQGLLGAEQLLADIEKMEQFRITTDSRKNEIEKTISLASAAPAEFQKFRETGRLTFETREAWFDRDFPGHYLRLIRDVRVSTIALVPPTEGIRATLSNAGISRTMVGAPFEQDSIIYRLPDSIAISGTQNATGLFELSSADPMLLPFEGSGVATTWQLDMPKGANRFDFDTIFDIYLMIRYSALADSGYRRKVLEALGQDEEGFVAVSNLRYFSVRNEFPDAWYAFHNPVKGLVESEYADPTHDDYTASGKPPRPFSLVLDVEEADFVGNEERRRISGLTIGLNKARRTRVPESPLRLKVTFLPAGGEWGIDDVSSFVSFAAQDGKASTVDLNGRNPTGRWVVSVVKDDGAPVADTFDPAWLQDLLMVIEYRGKAHYGN